MNTWRLDELLDGVLSMDISQEKKNWLIEKIVAIKQEAIEEDENNG